MTPDEGPAAPVFQLYITVNDPDFKGALKVPGTNGPVTLKKIHKGKEQVYYTAGGADSFNSEKPFDLGPIPEIAPGLFRIGVPMSVLPKDIDDKLVVEYRDPNVPPGTKNNLSRAEATFAEHQGYIGTDKSVYIIGSPIVLTLYEPDLNLDSQKSEAVSLHLIRCVTDGGIDTTLDDPAFHAQPPALIETGKDTGIFQTVLTMPSKIKGIPIARGTKFNFSYKDTTPGDHRIPTMFGVNESVPDGVAWLTIYSSNFGWWLDTDKKDYGLGDRMEITIASPDQNHHPDAVDKIGEGNNAGVLTISSGKSKLSHYLLVESGPDTGMFNGSIQLVGSGSTRGIGPEDGTLLVTPGDSVTVSYDGGGTSDDSIIPCHDSNGKPCPPEQHSVTVSIH